MIQPIYQGLISHFSDKKNMQSKTQILMPRSLFVVKIVARFFANVEAKIMKRIEVNNVADSFKPPLTCFAEAHLSTRAWLELSAESLVNLMPCGLSHFLKLRD